MSAARRIPVTVLALAATGALALGTAACSSQDADSAATTAASTSAAASSTQEQDAQDDSDAETSCVDGDQDVATLAASTLAVGVVGFDDAAAAVDAGVRHIFIGSSTDLTMLDGQGDPERSVTALKERAAAAGGELTVSVDEEGGQVQRLGGIIGELPSARELADTLSPEEVRGVFAEHGRKMHDLGITMDFAPVLDLAGGESISDNAIGDRAFSDDPQVVADYGRAAIDGLLDADMTPVIKHFPGHGHATGDSHEGTVTTPPIEEMGGDLQPFAELWQIPGVAVMVGHMQTPGLDSGDVLGAETPSSLNPEAYRLLRDPFEAPDPWGGPGFDGVVFTDDLTGMQAITDLHSGPDAVVAALNAGADAPLTSTAADVQATVDGLVAAVESGDLDRARLEEAAERLCSV
ncbi:glycoside hydrolase family 3 N-terminal domain-containing protein [Corynebacterium sp. AOP40-9SA-29]|uniref:glycoside hydrolase family 3 N-terminal domain-containing protein n=1 Tax=Corynebacterium sp. AOP40-9SA-29 TaxID=3457677 RepID=UPI004033F50C